MNFTAIDFETATPRRDSACSIGLVVVKQGKIAKRFSTLIRPPSLEFDPRLIAIHGITPQDVADKPSFSEIWPRISATLSDAILVAHSASFDVGVLQHCLTTACIPWPAMKCACTLVMARKLLPGLRNHKLSTVAELFGVNLKHHDAASDAEVCAEVAILLDRLGEPHGVTDYARDYPEMCTPSSPVVNDRASVTVNFSLSDDIIEALERRDTPDAKPATDSRLNGLHFVFTGDFSTLTRDGAESLVGEHGGLAGGSVTLKTDFVVVGNTALDAFRRTGHTTGKLARAVELSTRGAKVKIIGESEFLGMLDERTQ